MADDLYNRKYDLTCQNFGLQCTKEHLKNTNESATYFLMPLLTILTLKLYTLSTFLRNLQIFSRIQRKAQSM